MKITVKVTKEVLERSKMCGYTSETKGESNTNCAVALAVRELFPNASVGMENIIFDRKADEKTSLPIEVTFFIYDFDTCEPEQRVSMEPFSFEIDVPDYIIEEIGIEEVKTVLAKSQTLELHAGL